MSSQPCTFYLKNACNRGSSCSFSHQEPIPETMSSRSLQICRYFLIGTCVFGNRCQRSHNVDSKKADHNEGNSDSYESPVDNGMARSDKRSAGEGEDEEVQDSLPSGHMLDPIPSEVDEEYAEPDVQESGPSRDDILNPPSRIKEACIFFIEGTCTNDHVCDFSHSISKDTKTACSGRLKGANLKSPAAPKSLDSSRKKVCKHYRQGRCQLEKGCIFLHPQEQQSKSLIEAPNTSTGLSCRPDSPLERPNGEEDDNTSLVAHAHDIEGNINDNAVHDESQDRMDQAPYSDVEFNGNHLDPPHSSYDDEAYQEQPDNGTSNPSHPTDSVDRDVEETCANYVEPVNNCFKPSNPASCEDEWEERSPPLPATRLQARQRVALPVIPPPSKYPHFLEIIPHWTQFADPHANKDVPFCKQLAQGGCSQGDRCRFRHSLTPEEYTLLFNDQQPNLWTLQLDGAAVSTPTSQPQVDSPHIPSAVEVKSSTFGECKFFPIGKCRNGKDCPFQHTQHPTAPVATVSNAEQDRQTSERPAFGTGTQNSRRPCQFYFERGHCNRGSSCKFDHGNADGNHPSFGPSGSESALSLVNNDEGGSTGREKANNNNSDADTPAEDNGWGNSAAADWNLPSEDHSAWNLPSEDHSAWNSPSGNDYNHQPRPRNSNVCFQHVKGNCHRGLACRYSHDQEYLNKPLSSEAPKTENDGWPPTDDSSHSVPWSTAPPTQCPYFLKGNCRNDNSCHMSHVSEEKPQEGSRSEKFYKAEDSTNEPEEIVQNESQSTWEMEREPKILSESEPKAQEGERENLQILDNEATWSESQSWHTETVQPTPFPMKIYAPCKRFGQGYCPFKDDCTYLHIQDSDIVEHTGNSEGDVSIIPLANDDVPEPEPEPEPELSLHDKPDSDTTIELEPVIFDHPIVERHILNCVVSFGIDATPDQITTAADSKKLILSNLPAAVSPTDIKELAEPFGEIRAIISLDETEHTTRIEIEFAECSQAFTAFNHLNGHPFESHTISANLKGRTPMTVRSSEHIHAVKVVWPAPSTMAWVHYTTISKAKSEAIRLDGVIVGGLQIKAVSVPPLKRQKASYAVEIRGLPINVSRDVLEELCPEQSCITLNVPCYTQDPSDGIRSALTHCGELEDVDIPVAASHLTSVVAFATFKTVEAALEAMEALDGRNQDYLGGQPLSVRPVYYFRHRATTPQFEAVKNEIDRLNDKAEKKCSIQYQELHERGLVWIRIHAAAENLTTFASLNTELATILRGMLLTSNGDVVWDNYFETSSSAKSIDTINTTNSNGPFFVQCDGRMKNIRIFGAKPDQEFAQKLVMRVLQKVHKLHHEIQLPRTKLRGLVNGGLTALQDDLGVNKVLLDVANAKLIVRGTPDDDSKVEDYIGSLDSFSAPETTEALCEICHHLPVDPILLTCRHTYCTLCLQMALRCSPSAPFQCISRDTSEDGLTTQCPANVPYVVIRDIIPNEEKKFLHESFLSHVRSSEEFFFCPTLDCQLAYRTGVEGLTLKCFKCLSEICCYCRTRAHAGIACKENRI